MKPIQRPIIFSTPMVQAILTGSKTQTRRIVKPQPSDYGLEFVETKEGFSAWVDQGLTLDEGSHRICPYGIPGDLLWVKETWALLDDGDYAKKSTWPDAAHLDDDTPKWKPPIFMPKDICRIFLEVTDIRVERLMDITEQDAKAEGAPLDRSMGYGRLGMQSYREGFINIWLDIYDGKSLKLNPWAWAIEFKRIII